MTSKIHGLVLTLALIFSHSIYAKKSLSAHEHGSATLSLAYDNTSVEIELESPADSVLGFEHAPKSDKEKKVFETSKTLWNNLTTELVIFSKDLNCKANNLAFRQIMGEEDEHEDHGKDKKHDHHEEGHSEIEASATVTCDKKIAGDLTIQLKKHFKHMKNLKLEIMGVKPQSLNIKKEIETIKL